MIGLILVTQALERQGTHPMKLEEIKTLELLLLI